MSNGRFKASFRFWLGTLAAVVAILGYFFGPFSKTPSAPAPNIIVKPAPAPNIEVSPKIEVNPTIIVKPEISITVPAAPAVVQPAREPVFTLLNTRNVTGRKEEIKEIVAFVENGEDVIVTGIPGMMQKDVAMAAAKKLKEKNVFKDGVLQYDAGPNTNEIDIMDGIALQLGVDEFKRLPEKAKPTMFVKLMHSKKLLLVILNIFSKENVRFLIDHKGASNLLLAGIGRFNIDGIEEVELEKLKDRDAQELFQSYYGQCDLKDKGDMIEICKILNNHPLAISIAARICINRRDIPGGFLEELRKKEVLDVLKIRSGRGEKEEAENNLLISFSLAYKNLPDSAQELFRSTAVFAAGNFSKEGIMEVTGRDDENDLMDLLTSRFLDRPVWGGRYVVPIELIDFSRKLLTGNREEEIKYHKAALKYFVQYSDDAFEKWDSNDHRESIELYEKEIQNVRSVRKWALENEKWREVSDLFTKCFRFLQSIGRWEESLNWGKDAVTAAEKLVDKNLTAMHANNLGQTYRAMGDLKSALEWAIKAKDIDEELNNKPKMAIRYSNMGTIYQAMGDLKNALEWTLKAKDMAIELNNKPEMAIGYSNLGTIYKDMGDLKKALEWTIKAKDMAIELNNKPKMAIRYSNLGQIYQAMGDLKKALEWSLKATEIDEELNNKPQMAIGYNNLGQIYKGMGDLKKGLKWFIKSKEILEELGDKVHLKILYGNLSIIYAKMGNKKKAEEYLKLEKEIQF